jgi:hypothetical protein
MSRFGGPVCRAADGGSRAVRTNEGGAEARGAAGVACAGETAEAMAAPDGTAPRVLARAPDRACCLR